MKRILIFSVAYHPFIGGAEVAVKEITDRTPDIEFDMITINLDGKQKSEEKIGNVHIYRVGRGTIGKFLFPISGYFKAQTLHRTNTYSAIWSIMASQASVAAAHFKSASDLPLILTVQEGDEESHLKRYVGGSTILYKIFIRPFYTRVFKRATIITAISIYLRDRARAINHKVPIEIIPNGVDLKLFTKQFLVEEKEAVREELCLSKNDKILITTSRLVKKNAVEDIITSLISLPEHVKFIILGVGPLEKDLKKQVEHLKLEHRVQLLGQKLYQDIPKYLAASDIFIRPSLSEGMGNSFIEAMAAGIPVIATPVGGILDFLKEGETGLFCDIQNPHSIAEKVLILLENTDLRNKIITNARKLAIEKYDWSRIAEEMHKKVFSKI